MEEVGEFAPRFKDFELCVAEDPTRQLQKSKGPILSCRQLKCHPLCTFSMEGRNVRNSDLSKFIWCSRFHWAPEPPKLRIQFNTDGIVGIFVAVTVHVHVSFHHDTVHDSFESKRDAMR